MINQQTRNISFQSIKSLFRSTKPTPATELQKPLTSLPNATGNGAFVEPISYQVLGASSNLLNIKLPRSSILNIRYSNSQQKLIAINGHVNSMYTELARSSENNLIFQRCFNQSQPMSLLLSLNAQNGNFAVIDNLKSKWIIKRSSLFAWSGPSVRPTSSDTDANLIQMDGEGTFVVATPGQILQVDLGENETLQINSKSLIGYSTKNERLSDSIAELNNSVKSVIDVTVKRAPLYFRFNWLRHYLSLPEGFWKDPTVQQVHQTFSTISNRLRSFTNYIRAKLISSKKTGYFIEMKGPKTIFLSNAVNINDQVLTDAEIKKLLS